MSKKILNDEQLNLRFSKGERVLWCNGSMIYDAKCVEAAVCKNFQGLYYIHIIGYSKSLDKWVQENKLLKYNKTNVMKKMAAKKHVLRRHHRLSKLKNSKSSSEKENYDVLEDQNKSDSSSKELSVRGTKFKIDVPYELKTILIKDGDMITKKGKLVNLPATLTVAKLIKKYMKVVKESHGKFREQFLITSEVCKKIKFYFNLLLGRQLLYKAEREQYNKILKDMPLVRMTKIYGSIHFLRLFTKLTYFLNLITEDKRKANSVRNVIYEFLKYLFEQKNFLFGESFYCK